MLLKIVEAFHDPRLQWQRMKWEKHSLGYLCQIKKNENRYNPHERESQLKHSSYITEYNTEANFMVIVNTYTKNFHP